ncbi:MAG: Xaa-Pro peptidase family protein [Pirellulaceae bacterium]|nr:Xaa-Pro peptidase family protein [Pirellulaceae bacterium]
MSQSNRAIVMAGIPELNAALYRRLRFSVGDPAALVEIPQSDNSTQSTLILRDIEMHRARQHARVDQVACPADFSPESGLSGDRETATAQSVAECLRRAGVKEVFADRSLPLIYADIIRQAGINVVCDAEMGILDRRAKDEQEITWLREAQNATEDAMEMACRLICAADVRADGVLLHKTQPLTSERLRAIVDHWLLERGYTNPPAIIAGGPTGADCHNIGSGELRTGLPVIVDIFPRNRATHYNGDCTRTAVNGEISDTLRQMHAAVVKAKVAATTATRPGATGEQVHLATKQSILASGYNMGLPGPDDPDSFCTMSHGSGHGIGLDVHEPPLLDMKGPPLVVGDALTIEPGLYRRDLGGVRVEDMVIVTADGCENLNKLPGELAWS